MSADTNTQPLLEVQQLKVHFGGKANLVRAVDDVSFSLFRGETLAIVGESGCGKSTTAMSIIDLVAPTSGEIIFDGQNLQQRQGGSKGQKMALKKRMQIVFQDPYSSLNPRMTLATTLDQPLKIHGLNSAQRRKKIASLLDKVGLSQQHASRYPHEFSGGQRQRIGIARALALEPQLIICDEAVSALDVSIQAQIINLLIDLQEEFKLSYLFISHDLAVVEHVADRVAVMYLGKIVEIAPFTELYANPKHPYTQALLSAIPVADPRRRQTKQRLKGDVPSPLNPPSGCSFHPRCPRATDVCKTYPPLQYSSGDQHIVSCHYAQG